MVLPTGQAIGYVYNNLKHLGNEIWEPVSSSITIPIASTNYYARATYSFAAGGIPNNLSVSTQLTGVFTTVDDVSNSMPTGTGVYTVKTAGLATVVLSSYCSLADGLAGIISLNGTSTGANLQGTYSLNQIMYNQTVVTFKVVPNDTITFNIAYRYNGGVGTGGSHSGSVNITINS